MRQLKRSIHLRSLVWFSATCLLMAACAAAPDTPDPKEASSATENRAQSAQKSNKIDACALVPKSAVETILGQKVQSADLVREMEGTSGTAAFSECRYQLDARQMITLSARRSPVADNTPEAIKQVRDTMKEMTGKEATDVAGLGDTAFWFGGTRQLHVFHGGNIYLYVTMMNFKDEAQAKEKATELARQALLAIQGQS